MSKMEFGESDQVTSKIVNHISEDNVKFVIKSYCEDLVLESFSVYNASDKMLGFLADYWRLKVKVIIKTGKKENISFFIKAISRTNEAKAQMVKNMNLYNMESNFYTTIKTSIKVAGLKPWSPRLVAQLDDAMVFEDLNDLKYKLCPKLKRFDIPHTIQALNTLARFHASSIIFEETKGREMNKRHTVRDAFREYLLDGGYKKSCSWFGQCMKAALEVLRSIKYGESDEMRIIEERWESVWYSALDLNDRPQDRNVVCHRDLWNNNLLFHYKMNSDNILEPDDCLFVDFQAAQIQHPAGDFMLLLHCNLDPKMREDNFTIFLDHYYEMLTNHLEQSNVFIDDIFSKDSFLVAAEEYRIWGLVITACLLPQIWLDDDECTEIFNKTDNFKDIMNENKTRFILERIKVDNDYKEIVMEIFEEIVTRYCLKD